jgi:hypothetical protein
MIPEPAEPCRIGSSARSGGILRKLALRSERSGKLGRPDPPPASNGGSRIKVNPTGMTGTRSNTLRREATRMPPDRLE